MSGPALDRPAAAPFPQQLWLLFLLFEAVATGLDLLWGPHSALHWEERFNARAGLQLACGHTERLLDLQYRSFCGGCTAESLLAVPLFRALGPYDLSWKLIPAGIHLAIYALLTAWAGRAQGRAGLLMAAGLMMAAPGFYRALSLTGWGNHAESSLFTLGAIWLLWPRGSPPRLQAMLRGLLAGAVCGAGFWFCHTSLHAVPALLLLSLAQLRGWGLAGLLIGAPLGLLPLRESLGDRPEVMDATERWWLRWDAAPPDALADWLFLNPLLRGGGSDHSFALWDPALYPLAGWIGALWWWSLWLLAAASLLTLLRQRPLLREGRWVPAGLLLGLLSAYALRHDLWSQLPDVPDDPTLNLRYLGPLFPTLVLCLVCSPARRWMQGLSVLLILVGSTGRGYSWTLDRTPPWELRVYAHDGWPDRTVPQGQPPQRLARGWGRAADIEAALQYLESHQDPWEDCRLDHLFELGRRQGLGLGMRTPQGAYEERVLQLLREPQERWLWSQGVARGWLGREGDLDAIRTRWESLELPSALREELGQALGARLHTLSPGRSPLREEGDPPSWERGRCLERGRQGLSEEGCEGSDWWRGRGWWWALARGCGPYEREALLEEGGPESLLQGLDEACPLLRGGG